MMKRVLVLGCPGSGKSTFSRKLNQKTALPICYLDRLLWNSDKTTVSRDVFNQRLAKELQKPTWIMDGNYSFSLPMRLLRCDTIFLLDYPTEVCLNGVRARIGKKRPDMPWIEEKEDPEFMNYIQTFKTDKLPKLRATLNRFPNKNQFVFHSRDEANKFLDRL
ncbi:P-loop NTPase family protein [Lactobacillus amylolyticus]|uniref:adenylate kinase n=1 Tax=Lactobacillus amylolyticus TaxID=83683 RepID=UPI001F49D779|nr:adenylate kinase [Lactobacillus amylolyticus]